MVFQTEGCETCIHRSKQIHIARIDLIINNVLDVSGKGRAQKRVLQASQCHGAGKCAFDQVAFPQTLGEAWQKAGEIRVGLSHKINVLQVGQMQSVAAW